MSEKENVERAFEILKEAKSLEANSEFWEATEKFVAAHGILKVLAEEASANAAAAKTLACSTSPSPSQKERNVDERVQIANLYASKAQEYWNQSRQCLIRAMQQEKDRDEMRTAKLGSCNSTSSNNGAVGVEVATDPPTLICEQLDDNQASSRNQTFATLFSRPITGERPLSSSQPTLEEQSSVLDQQWSIEERLHELNKSLPSGFKTTDERMSDINRGLNKLGLSLYAQKEPFARFQEALPKSEEELMEEIMAQARDEVAMEASAPIAATVDGSAKKGYGEDINDDAISDDDNADDEDDRDGEEYLEDDQFAFRNIRRKVIRAQTKLAELLALLDAAREAKDKVDQIEEGLDRRTSKRATMNDDSDDDSEDAAMNENMQKVDVAFFMGSGKRKLKSAQRILREAHLEWEDSSLSK